MNGMNDNTRGTDGSGVTGPFGDIPATPFTDRGLERIDLMLASVGAHDRADATQERLDRIIAATAPMVGVVHTEPLKFAAHAPSTRDQRRHTGSRPTGMRWAAGLALMLSVGAALIASRSLSTPKPTPQVAAAPDETAGLDLIDAFFSQSSVGDAWTDAEALHSRVSADLNSYWGGDDLFNASDTQSGDSL